MNAAFAKTSTTYLREYLARIERAVEILPEADLWWRPHPDTLSAGNILLHLSGNVRQWIVSGLGSANDGRDRAAEFAATEGATGAELLEALRRTVQAAAATIDALDERSAVQEYSIQGTKVRGWEAVYHVVEHFSWHTGQLVWIAKTRAGDGHGLAFYDDEAVNRAHND